MPMGCRRSRASGPSAPPACRRENPSRINASAPQNKRGVRGDLAIGRCPGGTKGSLTPHEDRRGPTCISAPDTTLPPPGLDALLHRHGRLVASQNRVCSRMDLLRTAARTLVRQSAAFHRQRRAAPRAGAVLAHSPIRPTLASPRASEPTRNHVRASIRPQRVAPHAASFVPRASLSAVAGAWANPRPARRRCRKDGSLAGSMFPDPTRTPARRRGSVGAVRIALAWPGSRGARRPSRHKRVAAPSRGLSPASGPAAPEDCELPPPPAPQRLSATAPASGWRFSSWLATKRSAV